MHCFPPACKERGASISAKRTDRRCSGSGRLDRLLIQEAHLFSESALVDVVNVCGCANGIRSFDVSFGNLTP